MEWIVIDVKGESVEVLENNLFSQTQLEQSFGINFTVLVNGPPKILDLKKFAVHQHQKMLLQKEQNLN